MSADLGGQLGSVCIVAPVQMGKRQIAAQELAQENRLRQFGFPQNLAFLLDTQRRKQLDIRMGGIAFGQPDMVVV